jgi:hypothetical protein
MQKGTSHTARVRAQISRTVSERWKDAKYRRKNLAAVRSDEYRRKQSRRMKRLWNDPKYRAKTVAAQRAAARG